MIQEGFDAGSTNSVIPYITHDYSNNEALFDQLDFNIESHTAILKDLPAYLTEFDSEFGIEDISNMDYYKTRRYNHQKFSLMNGSFEWMDARVFYYMLQKQTPKKMILIGSSEATLLAHHINTLFHLNIEIMCIEPDPPQFLKKLHTNGFIKLIQANILTVVPKFFQLLGDNDILFIDSTHVVKVNSDVMYYFTKVFPVLNKGVRLHLHDIFFPLDYPADWLKSGRFWNEQYVLYTFLQFNTKFKIDFCTSYALFKYTDRFKEIQKDCYEMRHQFCKTVFGGGSIWMKVLE